MEDQRAIIIEDHRHHIYRRKARWRQERHK